MIRIVAAAAFVLALSACNLFRSGDNQANTQNSVTAQPVLNAPAPTPVPAPMPAPAGNTSDAAGKADNGMTPDAAPAGKPSGGDDSDSDERAGGTGASGDGPADATPPPTGGK